MLLQGKTAIITGCNRGIGKSILDVFAENGCNVFAIVRSNTESFENYVAELASKYKTEIHVIEADFSDESQIKEAAKNVLSYKIPIDILVNNVGTDYNQAPFIMTKMETMHSTFQVNYFSHIYLTQIISKSMMRKRQGSVVFISSAAAFDGGANVQYASSKAALVGGCKRLALELGGYNIRVNCIAPGLTDTDLTKDLSDDDLRQAFLMTMLKRKGTPREIANSVLFLGSDLSTFMTGQVIHVDGGIR